MEEIVCRLADLRDDYFEARKRLADQHSSWNQDSDVRLAMFLKIVNVLNCTRHGLAHLTIHMRGEDWWQEHIDIVPLFDVRAEQAMEFNTFCKIGCFHGVFSILECSLRQIVRTLDPTACGNGSAGFNSIYTWLLGQLSLKTYDSLLDLLRCTRNTFHNNGYYFHQSGSDHTVMHEGTTYEFHLGKPVEFMNWEFMLDRFIELRGFLEAVAEAPKIAGISRIAEP